MKSKQKLSKYIVLMISCKIFEDYIFFFFFFFFEYLGKTDLIYSFIMQTTCVSNIFIDTGE